MKPVLLLAAPLLLLGCSKDRPDIPDEPPEPPYVLYNYKTGFANASGHNVRLLSYYGDGSGIDTQFINPTDTAFLDSMRLLHYPQLGYNPAAYFEQRVDSFLLRFDDSITVRHFVRYRAAVPAVRDRELIDPRNIAHGKAWSGSERYDYTSTPIVLYSTMIYKITAQDYTEALK